MATGPDPEGTGSKCKDMGVPGSDSHYENLAAL